MFTAFGMYMGRKKSEAYILARKPQGKILLWNPGLRSRGSSKRDWV